MVNYWDKYTEMHGQQNVKIILDLKDIRCEAVVWIHLVLHRGRVAGSFEDIDYNFYYKY